VEKLKIDFEAIQKEIERLGSPNQDGGFTTQEMADGLSRSAQWCRFRIRDMIESGVLKHIGDRKITRIDGKIGYSAMYQFVKTGKKK